MSESEHPLSRLGIAAIQAARSVPEESAAYHEVLAAAGPDWHVARGAVTPSGMVAGAAVVVARGVAMTVDVAIGGFTPDDVGRADGTGWEVAQTAGPGLTVRPMLRVTGRDLEPREVVAPTGRPVAITGDRWLAGLLRSHLTVPPPGPGSPPRPEEPAPEPAAAPALLAAMEAANRRVLARTEVTAALLTGLDPARW
ncbi:MAG: hypothetical protein GEV11_25470 [Streptosporangiales bacterium]|nr:hypothetical protein [Streptosporangiales bacterium]